MFFLSEDGKSGSREEMKMILKFRIGNCVGGFVWLFKLYVLYLERVGVLSRSRGLLH